MTTKRDERRARRRAAAGRSKQVYMVIVLTFCLLAVVALVLDMAGVKQRRAERAPDSTTELQRIVLGMDGPRYVDPNGLFSIVKPAGWTTDPQPPEGYNVRFYGPNSADLRITATPVEYNDFASLLKDLRNLQAAVGMHLEPEPVKFCDQPAARRVFDTQYARLLVINFVEDHVAHMIQFSAPHELFDKYEPVLTDVINTYRPGPVSEE